MRIITDYQSRESLSQMTSLIKKQYKHIDIIMHIAGGGLGIKNVFPSSEEYLKVLNLNFFLSIRN